MKNAIRLSSAGAMAVRILFAAVAAFPEAQLVDDERTSPDRTPWSRSA